MNLVLRGSFEEELRHDMLVGSTRGLLVKATPATAGPVEVPLVLTKANMDLILILGLQANYKNSFMKQSNTLSPQNRLVRL